MMNYVIKMPGRYYQGPGLVNDIGFYSKSFCGNVLMLISKRGYDSIGRKIIRNNKDSINITPQMHTEDLKVDTVVSECIDKGIDGILGVGGGTIIDIAKYIAYKANISCIVFPTVASSDAPCTSMIVPKIYSDRDTMMIRANRNPDVVIVDTEVLLSSPVRYMRAGIGDAIATYSEALACYSRKGITMSHGVTPSFMINMAKDCQDVLLNESIDAINSMIIRDNSSSFDKVIMNCIYVSGILSENCGLSIPHAFSLAYDEVYPGNKYLHGEKVAYGLLLHYALLGNYESVKEYSEFLACVGLPIRLKDLGNPSDDRIVAIAESISSNKLSRNFPIDVNVVGLCEAMSSINI